MLLLRTKKDNQRKLYVMPYKHSCGLSILCMRAQLSALRWYCFFLWLTAMCLVPQLNRHPKPNIGSICCTQHERVSCCDSVLIFNLNNSSSKLLGPQISCPLSIEHVCSRSQHTPDVHRHKTKGKKSCSIRLPAFQVPRLKESIADTAWISTVGCIAWMVQEQKFCITL